MIQLRHGIRHESGDCVNKTKRRPDLPNEFLLTSDTHLYHVFCCSPFSNASVLFHISHALLSLSVGRPLLSSMLIVFGAAIIFVSRRRTSCLFRFIRFRVAPVRFRARIYHLQACSGRKNEF